MNWQGHTLVIGAPGEGKSSVARAVTAPFKRRVSLDPSRDWQKNAHVEAARSLDDLSARIASQWGAGFDLTFTPPPGDEAEALHKISNLLCSYQEKHARGAQLALVVDEMAESYGNAEAMTREFSGFRRIRLQGRHFGISVVGITQQPADVSAKFRGVCRRWFIFPVYDARAEKAIFETIGWQHAAQLHSLPKWHFLMREAGTVSVADLSKLTARAR